MDFQIETYAPVVVPTLNRYEHFSRCLESLEKCHYAENTIVYIALDYPPSNNYKEGWIKISNYLRKKITNHNFKDLIILSRDRNYGIQDENSNVSVALREILKKYDRYILTEDDNVFSYRFLEYINLALEKYKDDKSILTVCGYMHPINFKPSEKFNCVKLQEMSAWGYGTWKDRVITYQQKFVLIEEMLNSSVLRKRMVARRADIYTGLLAMKEGHFIWGDCFYTAYQQYKQMYSIFPVKTLVKNCGWDGSGTHGGVVSSYLEQKQEAVIREHFDLFLADETEMKAIDKAVIDYWKSYTTFTHKALDYISIIIYKFTRYIITFKSLRNFYKKLRSCFGKRKGKKLDILLLTRPDHSLQIYETLNKQEKLSFLFVTYNVFNKFWKFLKIPKIQYVGANARILKMFSCFHILKYKIGLIKKFNEFKCYNSKAYVTLRRRKPRLIHYWPSYCHKAVRKYKRQHSEVITIAEQYMPNPIYVLNIMEPIYKKNGLMIENTYLARYAQSVLNHFDSADYIVVPSKFVEETMRYSFPTKNYKVVSYGIQRSPKYKSKLERNEIKEFVYAGGISLEKGSDIILDYFSTHPELNLHLYGNISKSQRHLFTKYKDIKNIHFYGSVSKDELREVFQIMDVAIHPSRYDAYSLAVAEEIGAGLPVIVSKNTGNFLGIVEHQWGLVFELDEPSSLEEVVKRMCDVEQYHVFQSNIENTLSKPLVSYGEKVCRLYQTLLSGNDIKN